jgi:hypothetical protein
MRAAFEHAYGHATILQTHLRHETEATRSCIEECELTAMSGCRAPVRYDRKLVKPQSAIEVQLYI